MIALLLALRTAAFASQPPTPTPAPKTQSEKSKPEHQNSDTSPTPNAESRSVNIQGGNAEQERGPNTKAESEKDSATMKWTDVAITVFTGVLALFAFLQWRVYLHMLKMGRLVERAWISLELLEIRIYKGKDDHNR